jgi:hypothetical protein
MKRIRVIGVCLVAAFAISAVASVTASAFTPEFYAKAAVGTTVGPIPFTGTLGAAFLEGKGGVKITCLAGSAKGEVTSATTTKNNTTTFTGCETGGFPCENAGAGTIKTETLEGTLGAVAAKKDGIRLYNESTKKGGQLAAFECAGGAVKVVVKGSVIAEATGASGTSIALGKLPASTHDLTFTEVKGIQKYTKFLAGEGEAGTEQLESNTNGGPFELSGQSVKVVLATSPVGLLGYTEN